MNNKIANERDIFLDCKKEVFETVFNDLKYEDLNYLNGYDNEFGLYMLYEALIYFISTEEFEKCALIRKQLNHYYKTLNYYIPS